MRIRCKSGLMGYRCRLRSNYDSFQQFQAYAEMYGLHNRLGYRTIKGAWKANPMVEGSIEPSDFRKVPAMRKVTA
jgi:hypothetical protein